MADAISEKKVAIVDECKINNEQRYLDKILVVLVCVGIYDGDKTGLLPLKGTSTDHKRMKRLFGSEYKYTIITNKSPKVTEKDFKTILRQAETEFTENEYDGIITIFSGHGNRDYLLLSDYTECIDYKTQNKVYTPNKYSRMAFESYFNGNKFKGDDHRATAFKIYFVDACRGEELSQTWGKKYVATDNLGFGKYFSDHARFLAGSRSC